MNVDAVRLSDGVQVEVWTNRKRLAFGQAFKVDGVRYRRIVNRIHTSLGGDPGFHTKGAIEMWTEPPRGRGPVLAKHYSKDGFPLMSKMQDVREYQAQSKDTGRPVEWTK